MAKYRVTVPARFTAEKLEDYVYETHDRVTDWTAGLMRAAGFKLEKIESEEC